MNQKLKSTTSGKDITYELIDYTQSEREQFHDAFTEAEASSPQKFSLWCKCVRTITSLTDEEMLKMTDLDIIQVAVDAYLFTNNKKKDKK